ncbi:aminoglycoside phosphotransferase family protein [Actinoplanes oblitus]|uniref:Aminoglycoside phosphotransferase family protein n=1 Tax=Actinoplanes oblitus TaxID=3040509 RepID=A0ABY8WPC2_9ACTN|nr:aminoglycoside phosphotransferase family protein [Actinoplanes oblitus]WIM99272.1 aminoglycoside phosphotransferase family protein [Actinoplanes oblitus]
MVTVPEAFARWRAHVDGDEGRAWVASLPARVERLAGQWDLRLDDAAPLHGAQALVLLVTRDDRPLVLKLSAPRDPTTATEAAGLRAWAGRGVVELVAAEPGALLLERLDHTRSLHDLPILQAAEVAGGLIRTLAVAAPAGLPQAGSGIAATLGDRQRRLGDPVPDRFLARAFRYAAELPGVGENVLIHADLHYGNVLAGTRRPWLAIDPRPLRGTPEYAVPELMWNRADEVADLPGLLSALVEAGGLDAELARGWVIVRCVDYWLWGVERGLTIDPVRCERVLAALLPG